MTLTETQRAQLTALIVDELRQQVVASGAGRAEVEAALTRRLIALTARR